MVMNKKALSITSGSIVSLVLVIIMLVVFINIIEDVIPSGATAYYNLSETFSCTNETKCGMNADQVYGSDAASFAGDTNDYLGWFWVLGPFVLVLMAVVGIFMRGRR